MRRFTLARIWTPKTYDRLSRFYDRLDWLFSPATGDSHSKLLEGDPAIETLYEPAFLIDDYKGKLTMNTEYMLPGDDAIIVQRIKEILKAPR